MLALLAGLALAHTPHDATLFAALSADGRLLTGIGRSGIWYALESDDGGDDWRVSVVGRPGEGLQDAAWLADGRGVLIARREGLLIGSGAHWQPAAGIPEGADLEVLRAEPGGRRLLAGGAGLYRSVDGGERWERIALAEERITAAAWSPAADGRACVGTLRGRVFCSEDAGLSWVIEAELGGEVRDLALTGGGRIYAAGPVLTLLEPEGSAIELDVPGPVTAVGAWDDGLVLAGAEDSLWRSEGGGFVRCEEGLEPPDTYNTVQGGHYRRFLRDDRGRIWLASYEGLHTSADGGRSWRQLQTMGPSWHLDVAIPRGGQPLLMSSYGGAGLSALMDDGSWEAPSARSRALYLRFAAASPGYAEDGIAWLGERGNLWVTTEGGGRWVDVTDAGPYVADVEAVAVQSDGLGAAVALAGGSEDGALSLAWSDDGGAHFTRVPADAPAGARVLALGLSPDFAADGRMFAAVSDGEGALLLRSVGGRPFEAIGALPARPLRLVFDGADTLLLPTDRGVWRSVSERQPAPFALEERWVSDVAAAGGVYFAALPEGVVRSEDGGRTWGEPLLEGSYLDLALSPDFAADGRVAAAGPAGVWLSTDGGERWSLASSRMLLDVSTQGWSYDSGWFLDGAEWGEPRSTATAEREGAEARFRFRGVQIGLRALMNPEQGSIAASVDGGEEVDLSLGRAHAGSGRVWCADLDPGWHTLTVRVRSLPVQLDAAEVLLPDGLAEAFCEPGSSPPDGGCGGGGMAVVILLPLLRRAGRSAPGPRRDTSNRAPRSPEAP